MNGDAGEPSWLSALGDAGFDVAVAFNAQAIARDLDLPELADLARPVGILVGNTRALWPAFLAARAAAPGIAASSDPVEHYTETTLGPACQRQGGNIVYSHRRYRDAFLPFQRIAVAAGVAVLAPTQLLVHPTFGPWFALRAVILVAGVVPSPPAPLTLPCTCDGTCTQAFETARAAVGPDAWRAWLAVRDACPIGRAYRYDDAQIAYHYTKDPRFLRAELR